MERESGGTEAEMKEKENDIQAKNDHDDATKRGGSRETETKRYRQID